MRRNRTLIAVGLLGIAGLTTGCKDQTARDAAAAAQASADAAGATGTMVDEYLKSHYAWEKDILMPALCRMERLTPPAHDPDARICPTGPVDTKYPPPYPPKQP